MKLMAEFTKITRLIVTAGSSGHAVVYYC